MNIFGKFLIVRLVFFLIFGAASALMGASFSFSSEESFRNSCIKNFALLADQAPSKIKFPRDPEAVAQENYHRLIREPLKEMSRATFADALKETLETYAALYPAFPRTRFEKWLTSHPVSSADYHKIRKQGMTLGEVLQKEYSAFQRPDLSIQGRKKLQWGANRALEEVRDSMARFDRNNPQAFERIVAALPRKIEEAFKGSCLAKNPISLKSVGRDFIVMMSSYALLHASKEHPTVENFPWEYVAASLVFWSVLGEVGCRNMLASSHQLGAEILESPELWRMASLKKFFVERKDGMIAYFRWSVLLNPVGIGVIAAGEKYRGKEGAPEDYAIRLGYFLAYDSILGTLRRTFILDPLFLHLFPWLEPALKPLFKSGILASLARNSAELGARVGLRWGDMTLFLEGDAKIKEYLERRHTVSSGDLKFPKMKVDQASMDALREMAEAMNAIPKRKPN